MASDKYQVIARKWRPQAFDEVVGQEHITRTLQNALTSGRIGHAFLFIGSRGIGKTTTARILAKALNCLAAESATPEPCGTCDNCRTIAAGNNIDVIEIDGASNRGIDDAREIRENVRLAPSQSRYKVYIIDEVHQLTREAFNALLKTLEEPPPHAVFVLATTEAHKVPATIISRCQRFDFRRVSQSGVVALLKRILDADGIEYSEDALYAIARAADGGVRDAESILDQLVSYCGGRITFQDVFDVLGLVDWQVLNNLCDAVLNHDVGQALLIVDHVVVHGKDLAQFVEEILRYYRNLLVCKTADATALLSLPEDEIREMQSRATQFKLTDIIRLVEEFAELTKGFDTQLSQRIALEALLVKACKETVEISADTVIAKLLQLGSMQAAGAVAVARAAEPPISRPVAPAKPVAEAAPVLVTADDPKPALNDANLARHWPRIQEAVADKSMSLGVWLAQATPVTVEEGTLVLEFGAQNDQARRQVLQTENLGFLTQVLEHLFGNVRSVRGILAAEDPQTAADQEGQSSLPFLGSVPREDGERALQDPAVAKIVEVFKGRIVEVKQKTL